MSARALDPGDTIEISVTHEIKIHGDKTWVGARITSKVRESEDAQDAENRVGNLVQQVVMDEIARTVETVGEAYK